MNFSSNSVFLACIIYLQSLVIGCALKDDNLDYDIYLQEKLEGFWINKNNSKIELLFTQDGYLVWLEDHKPIGTTMKLIRTGQNRFKISSFSDEEGGTYSPETSVSFTDSDLTLTFDPTIKGIGTTFKRQSR